MFLRNIVQFAENPFKLPKMSTLFLMAYVTPIISGVSHIDPTTLEAIWGTKYAPALHGMK